MLDKRKYRAALIDEFQDTDRLQAGIFARIFEQPSKSLFLIGDPKQSIYAFRGSDLHVYQEWRSRLGSCFGLFKNYRSSPLLLEAVHALYTAHEGLPFLDPDLEYHPTQAASRKGEEEDRAALRWSRSDPLTQASDEVPLHFILSEKKETEEKRSAQESRAEMETWIAAEIKRLLLLAKASQLHYKDRALRAEDIAILVRKGSEGLAMRQVLQEEGIAAVLCVDENVFSSSEALELELVLGAIQEGGRGSKLKAALSTELWGCTAHEIYGLFQSESKKAETLRRIRSYANTWVRQGFTAMFRQWLYGEEIHCRLLERSLGERKLSNLLHIAELIQLSKAREPERVLYFLREEIAAARNGSNSSQEHAKLRIESDRNAVQIMTIHASKGLEFPVVFCPCLSQSRRSSIRQNKVYYDKEKKMQVHALPFLQKILKYPLGSRRLQTGLQAAVKKGWDLEAIAAAVSQESLAEELRLLYVALTRARERLYVCLIEEEKQNSNTAAFHLFCGGQRELSGTAPDIADKSSTSPKASISKGQNFAALKEHLGFLVQKCPQSIHLNTLSGLSTADIQRAKGLKTKPDKDLGKGLGKNLEQSNELEAQTELRARSFQYYGGIQSSLALYSFSRIVRQKEESDPLAIPYAGNLKAEIEKLEGEGEGVKSIFTFPRGTQAGNFFHEILENIAAHALDARTSFAELLGDSSKIKQIITTSLEKYGYSTDWQDCLLKHIETLFKTPLLKDHPSLSLSALKYEECAVELDFHFNLDAVYSPTKVSKPAANKELCLLLGINRFEELWPRDLSLHNKRRFLKGYIDFVFAFEGRFYIIDWKSNFLGSQSEDYSPERIEQNMQKHIYHLQYYIYMDALHRFLELRQANYEYETHFGGVFYIYLRGIDPYKNTGIYFTRPSLAQLQAFQNYASSSSPSLALV